MFHFPTGLDPPSRPSLTLELSVSLPSRQMSSFDRVRSTRPEDTGGGGGRDRDRGEKRPLQGRAYLGPHVRGAHPRASPGPQVCSSASHQLPLSLEEGGPLRMVLEPFLHGCPAQSALSFAWSPGNPQSRGTWATEEPLSWTLSCLSAWRAGSQPCGSPTLRQKERIQAPPEGWWMPVAQCPRLEKQCV